MKVYTKGGDKGETSLVGGTRVPKYDERIEAYGNVDELMAHIAMLRDSMDSDTADFQVYRTELLDILSSLMVVSANLACEESSRKYVAPLDSNKIKFLEERIDFMQAELPVIDKFTLPGGDPLISMSHICRTICRRSERVILKAAQNNTFQPEIFEYMNRLSDYFYVLGRSISNLLNVEEILWIPEKK